MKRHATHRNWARRCGQFFTIATAWLACATAALADPPATNLELWLKADAGVYTDAGTTLATTTQTVQQWNDQSGNGRNVTQATSGKRPQYLTGQFNSVAGVKFTRASAQWLSNAANINARTVFVVGKCTQSGTAWNGFCGGDTSDAVDVGAWYFFPRTGDTGIMRVACTTTADTVNVTDLAGSTGGALTDYHIYAMRVEGSGTTIENQIEGYNNGSDTTASPIRPAGGSGTVIGSTYYANSADGFELEGVICEVLIYDEEMSTANYELVMKYLSDKYIPERDYVLPSFLDAGTDTLRLLSSDDGITFTETFNYFLPTEGGVRDPHILKRTFEGETNYYLTYTSVDFSGGTRFGIAKGPTWFGPYETIANVECSSVATGGSPQVWSPIWFVDPANNKLYILVSIDASTGTFEQHYLAPTSDDLTTWSTPTEIASITAIEDDTIAGYIVKRSSTYYMFYKKEDATGYNQIASSSSPFTGYTSFKSGAWGPDWADAQTPDAFEGVHPVHLGGANWRVYMDRIDPAIGIHYSNSTDDWATWSTPAAITAPSPVPRNGLNMTTLSGSGLGNSGIYNPLGGPIGPSSFDPLGGGPVQ